MINALEKRLQKLENDIKDLKATYTIAGGNVKMYITKATFSVTVSSNTTKQVLFIPTYGVGQEIMATMSGKANYVSGSALVTCWGAHQQIQDGSGNVILEFPFVNYYGTGTNTYSLEVVVSATTPGTLSLV